MRPAPMVRYELAEPEVIVIDSDSDNMMEDEELEDIGPEVISISSDTDDMVDDGGPEVPRHDEVFHIDVLEDGEIADVGDIPTVNNLTRIGYWHDGFWCTPGNSKNYSKVEGYHVWALDEAPNDGVVGGLSHVGEGDLFKDTLGGLLYNQWLQNKDKPVAHHVSLGGSVYNAWLGTLN